jgi:peptidoglycan/LPS O-acetylase OafA/YrhL
MTQLPKPQVVAAIARLRRNRPPRPGHPPKQLKQWRKAFLLVMAVVAMLADLTVPGIALVALHYPQLAESIVAWTPPIVLGCFLALGVSYRTRARWISRFVWLGLGVIYYGVFAFAGHVFPDYSLFFAGGVLVFATTMVIDIVGAP